MAPVGDRDPNVIANSVLPVVGVRQIREGEVEITRLAGTAFLLADTNGLALTARHVAETFIPEQPEAPAVMLRGADGAFQVAAVHEIESHPTEDVAWLRLQSGDYPSLLTLSRSQENSAGQYMLWGYPDAIARDVVRDGRALWRPDLVFSEGHIRRRLSEELLIGSVQGEQFYELSAAAGAGCSGAPIMMRVPGRALQVVGVYVGERRSESGDMVVGYATRIADIDAGLPEWQHLFPGSADVRGSGR